MKSPLNTAYRITSPYGNRILGGKTEFHSGVDIVPLNGMHPCDIYAPFDGRIMELRNTIPDNHTGLSVTTYVTGNYVNLVTESDYTLIFRHLKYASVCVKAGQYVKAGDKLATMGSTGQSTGKHLHYEIRDKKSLSLDPIPYTGNDKVPWTVVAEKPAPVILKVGDTVKVVNAITYDGKPFKMYYNSYNVIQISGDRIVIGIDKTITAAVNAANIKKI